MAIAWSNVWNAFKNQLTNKIEAFDNKTLEYDELFSNMPYKKSYVKKVIFEGTTGYVSVSDDEINNTDAIIVYSNGGTITYNAKFTYKGYIYQKFLGKQVDGFSTSTYPLETSVQVNLNRSGIFLSRYGNFLIGTDSREISIDSTNKLIICNVDSNNVTVNEVSDAVDFYIIGLKLNLPEIEDSTI